MDQADLKIGDTVAVRGFKGIACWYAGPQTEPGETEYQAECYSCDGTGDGPDDIHDDDDCRVCGGSGVVLEYDEEPEPVETGRALVVMVGDDHRHVVDFEDLAPIDEGDVCSCGQIGCWSSNALYAMERSALAVDSDEEPSEHDLGGEA